MITQCSVSNAKLNTNLFCVNNTSVCYVELTNWNKVN